MEFNWIDKIELTQKYNVFGRFYNIELTKNEDEGIIKCRNDLQISDKSYANEFGTEGKPQLLMIMMNPGTSEPADPNYIIPSYKSKDAPTLIRKTEMVETVPDETQYQIMRIMSNMGYKHARVINISDLRNPISNNFASELKKIHNLDTVHSIFSEKREKELTEVFSNLNKDSIIFKAWGISIVNNCTSFEELVKKCLLALPTSQKQLGLMGESNHHFRHPLPFPPWSEKSLKKWLLDAGSLFN